MPRQQKCTSMPHSQGSEVRVQQAGDNKIRLKQLCRARRRLDREHAAGTWSDCRSGVQNLEMGRSDVTEVLEGPLLRFPKARAPTP